MNAANQGCSVGVFAANVMIGSISGQIPVMTWTEKVIVFTSPDTFGFLIKFTTFCADLPTQAGGGSVWFDDFSLRML
jgi:hypothetical protein